MWVADGNRPTRFCLWRIAREVMPLVSFDFGDRSIPMLSSGRATCRVRHEIKKCRGVHEDRINLLKKWAGIRVRRRGMRTLADLRAASNRMKPPRDSVGQCWACQRKRQLFKHHIIQLQHGGTNWHLNIVKICDECHCLIHPWMKPFFNHEHPNPSTPPSANAEETIPITLDRRGITRGSQDWFAGT